MKDREKLSPSLTTTRLCACIGSFGRGIEVPWTGWLNRTISKPTLVGRCWPPSARPHTAPALTLLEILRLLRFQRRRASGQRRPGETALSQDLWIAYLKVFNPPHHLRPLSHSDSCRGGGEMAAACCGGVHLDEPASFVTDLETSIWEEARWGKMSV